MFQNTILINKLMKSVEPDKAFMREVAEHEKNISGLQKSQKNIQKLLKEYDDVYECKYDEKFMVNPQ